MKINEITVDVKNWEPDQKMWGHIPVIYTNKPVQIPGARANNMQDAAFPRKPTRLGSGREAYVYEFPGSTGTVIKYIKGDYSMSDYLAYVNEIMEYPENPFFPRIFNAKIYVYHGGEDVSVVKTEKLIPITDDRIKDAVLHQLINLGVEFPNGRVPNINLDDDPDVSWIESINVLFSLPGQIKKMIATTKNPEFAQALKVLQKIIPERGQDFIPANFMVRQTSTGPQLVFNDPI